MCKISDNNVLFAHRRATLAYVKIAAWLIVFGAAGCSGSDELPAPRPGDSGVSQHDTGTGKGDAGYGGDDGGERDGGESEAAYDSGDIETDSSAAPTDLSYERPSELYSVGTEITKNHARVTGLKVSFRITPALPVGLALDAAHGTISGTPTAVQPATEYTVTATNSSGSTTAKISIAVCAAPDAYWTFDEGAGDVANDASGHGHTGTLLGDPKPTWITGKIGSYALEFGKPGAGVEGTYVEVLNDVLLNAQAFTFAAWLYNDNEYLLTSYARRVDGWHVRTSSREWDFVIEGQGGRETVRSGYLFPNREWHHHVIVVDNTNRSVAFYVDGERTGETHAYTEALSDSTGALYIGEYDTDFRWRGGIDEVRFYGKALDSSAIRTLYQLYQSL